MNMQGRSPARRMIDAQQVAGTLRTRMIGCDAALSAQEQAYLQALQATTSSELTGNQLILRDGGRREVARFIRIG